MMNEIVLFSGNTLPRLIAAADDRARMRSLEFLTAKIRNANTRRSYAKATEEFLDWCSFTGVPSIAAVWPVSRCAPWSSHFSTFGGRLVAWPAIPAFLRSFGARRF
jgi:hypothetical protein